MDLARATELYNRCNPDEPLPPSDDRNVDIDVSGARGLRWAERLARQIVLSKRPVCKLFTGLRGTGKSTELRRLSEKLSSQGFHVALIDADDALDLTTEIDVSDILALVLVATERAVLQLEGKPVDAKDGLGKRFWTWLTTTEVSISKAKLGATGGGATGELELDFKTNPALRQQVRSIVSSHLSSFVKLVADELSLLDARARDQGKLGLVVIFDSLEKLRGTSQTWRPVLDSAERIFSNDAPYLQLPVHALYTVPPALTRRMATQVSFLPMIKIRDRFGAPHAAGMDVARELVRRRVPDESLSELFGSHAEARIREILSWSGGYPRELVRLLQSVLEEEDLPISEEGLRHILNRAGNTYRGIVHDSGAMDWLGRVLAQKALVVANDAEREAADLFLQNNVVLRYLNEEEWFDLHQSVQRMPEVLAARESFLAGSAAAAGAKPGDGTA
jgi:hypothetical protein